MFSAMCRQDEDTHHRCVERYGATLQVADQYLRRSPSAAGTTKASVYAGRLDNVTYSVMIVNKVCEGCLCHCFLVYIKSKIVTCGFAMAVALCMG
jgi:hypothetical protein